MIKDEDHYKPQDEEIESKIQYPLSKALYTSGIVVFMYLVQFFTYKDKGAVSDKYNYMAAVVCGVIIACAFIYCYVGYFVSKKAAKRTLTAIAGIIVLGMFGFVYCIMMEYI